MDNRFNSKEKEKINRFLLNNASVTEELRDIILEKLKELESDYSFADDIDLIESDDELGLIIDVYDDDIVLESITYWYADFMIDA